MRRVLLVVVVVCILASFSAAANILDLIYRGATADTNLDQQHNQQEAVVSEQKQDDSQQEIEEKTCACIGVECMCCVDFNMTFIDLGKGCVRMKYISQTEGVLLNVSYGDNLLRSGMSQGPQPAATCVSMIGQLAAICARFTSLVPHDDGLKGCLKLEPKLLGDIQTRLSVGCFIMNADGMQLDETVQELDQNQESTSVETEADFNPIGTIGENSGNLNEEEILAAVNETAQKGLAFFQNWLGLDFTNSNSGNGTQEDENNTETVAAKEANTTIDSQ